MLDDHSVYMRKALAQAEAAARQDEVPVGAVLVDETGTVIAQARNQTRTQLDPTAHAEIVALRDGAGKLLNYRLLNTTLYVTVEPCIMCMGAIVHARIARVVYGAPDPKWGAAGSLYNFSRDPRLNHQPQVVGGVLAEACGTLMQHFFKAKRSTG
jgi:tRNA(adenine34) deaminase